MNVKDATRMLMDLIELNEDYLVSHETDMIEFKNRFDWSNERAVAKYLKFMASVSNKNGGFLVFGVNDEDKLIIGDDSFERFDTEVITQKLNTYFSPNINIILFCPFIGEKKCSVIYINEFTTIPTVCIKNYIKPIENTSKPKDETMLTKGDIYYRYPGASEKIQPADLLQLFIKSFEKQASLKNIEQTEQFRKADLKPLFKYSSNAKQQDKIEFKYSLESEIIHVLNYVELKDNEYLILGDSQRNKFYQKGDKINIFTRHKTGKGYNENAYFNIGIHIADKDGRPYTFIISGRHQSKPKTEIIDGHISD